VDQSQRNCPPRRRAPHTPDLKRKARNWNTQRLDQLKRKTMWRTGVPIPHITPPWVRLCRLAQHSTSAIRRKRKRAQARDAQRLEELAPRKRPRLVAWRRRKKRAQPETNQRQQLMEPVDTTDTSPAATRLDDTRGGIVTPPDIRDRTGRETGPGEISGMDARGEGRVHRGGGGVAMRRTFAKADIIQRTGDTGQRHLSLSGLRQNG
jgi:hypothetical protein